MELQVRDARVTDVDRITALLAPTGALENADRDASDTADLLRQLVYLPNATVTVALIGREVVGAAVLSLRPSVRHGGLVGTVDLLVAAPEPDAERTIATLLAEVMRSARNKGCVVVEAEPPFDERGAEAWTLWGFTEDATRLVLEIGRGASGYGPEAGRRPESGRRGATSAAAAPIGAIESIRTSADPEQHRSPA